MAGREKKSAEQFVIRLPDGMRDQIAEAAKENGRSMNAEIVRRLEQTLKQDEQPLAETVKYIGDRLIQNVIARLDEVSAKKPSYLTFVERLFASQAASLDISAEEYSLLLWNKLQSSSSGDPFDPEKLAEIMTSFKEGQDMFMVLRNCRR